MNHTTDDHATGPTHTPEKPPEADIHPENHPETQATHSFALVEERATQVAFWVAGLGFLAYMTGLWKAYMPLEELTRHWGKPVEGMLAETGLPSGWGWLGHLGQSDFFTLGGIALLTGVTFVCYALLLPIYAAQKDRIYLVLVALQLVVFAVSAL